MGAMSNPSGNPNPTRLVPDNLVFRPAQLHERHPALRMALSSSAGFADEASVMDFINFADQRGIDLSGLWLAESAGKFLSALLPVISPGRTMLLFAPGFLPRINMQQATIALIDHVCTHCAIHDKVLLAQALIDPSQLCLQDIFIQAGFQKLARLEYLQGFPSVDIQSPLLPPGYHWVHYTPASHDLFVQTILQTYEGSLDCPALNGVRSIGDILAGHKASGDFDPSAWYALLDGSTPRGVLLLSSTEGSDALELVYLGLCPSARGLGLGRLLMQEAMAMVHRRNLNRLTLAADAQNIPAMRLYARFGMQPIGQKNAMMRQLSTPEHS